MNNAGLTGELVVHVDKDLEDITPDYLKNMIKDVDVLMEAVENNDFTKVRIIGHTLRGTGGGYGFDYLTELGAALEKAAIELNKEKTILLSKDLAGYLGRVRVVYE